jgi:predicted hydrocarbon binding protein
MALSGEQPRSLRLYSGEKTVTAIWSPVRTGILSLLHAEGEVSFSRIMEYTRRSKATVSVHVHALVDAGLIAEKPVSGDARKKKYVLTSSHLGDIVPPGDLGTNGFRELIRQCYLKYETFDCKLIIPHILQIALMEAGIRIDPIMIRGGEILAESFLPLIVSDTLEKTLENIAGFWKRYNLGTVKIRSLSPLQIEIYDCYECMVLPKQDQGSCFISQGMLSGFFGAYYGKKVVVRESECMVEGHPACCMEITVPDGP